MFEFPVLLSTELPEHVVEKTGPLFLGALFHWGLFGVLCTQVFVYFSAFPHDPLRNKLFVYGIFVLEVAQTVLLTKFYFSVFATGFGDAKSYDQLGAIWFSVPILSGIVAFLAEAFYALRVFHLSESYLVPGLIMALAVLQLGGAIACAMILRHADYFSRIPAMPFSVSSAIWTGGSAVCDAVIATAMMHYLWKCRTIGTESTQASVRKVIRLVLETGIITALVAILTLILTLLPHHASYYQVPASILAKLYSNSMMVLLNNRILNSPLNGRNDVPNERRLTSLSFKSTSSTGQSLSVRSTREVVVSLDGDWNSIQSKVFGGKNMSSQTPSDAEIWS